MKYKVGDKVRIRKDLKLNRDYGSCGFVSPMMRLIGKTVTIALEKDGDCYRIEEDNCMWNWTDKMIEGLANNEKIVITTNGNETLARLYNGTEVVKSATSKCSPDDEFDFMEGAKTAFERLQKSKYYNGKIVCVKPFTNCTTKGKIYKVDNGTLLFDNKINFISELKNLKDINQRMYSKFIELVEE